MLVIGMRLFLSCNKTSFDGEEFVTLCLIALSSLSSITFGKQPTLSSQNISFLI